MACHNKKVIIAKNDLPLAETTPHKLKEKRTLGLLAGKIEMPDDIMEEDETIKEMFYGQNLL